MMPLNDGMMVVSWLVDLGPSTWYMKLCEYVISWLDRLRHPCYVLVWTNERIKSNVGRPKRGSLLWKTYMEHSIWKEG